MQALSQSAGGPQPKDFQPTSDHYGVRSHLAERGLGGLGFRV